MNVGVLREEAEHPRQVGHERGQGRRGRRQRRVGDRDRPAPASPAASASSSRSRRVAPAARLAPALAPPTEIRPASTPSVGRGVAHPADGGDDVVVRHRVGDAAVAEPVVDADDDRAGPGADLAGDAVGLAHVEVAAEERAAVHPDQRGTVRAGRRRRGVDPHRHRPVRAGHGVGADVDLGRRCGAGPGVELLHAGAPSRGRPAPATQPMPSSRCSLAGDRGVQDAARVLAGRGARRRCRPSAGAPRRPARRRRAGSGSRAACPGATTWRTSTPATAS